MYRRLAGGFLRCIEYICNPSYTGGGVRRSGSEAVLGKSIRFYLKTLEGKKDWGCG
jgi:hypothetical protein